MMRLPRLRPRVAAMAVCRVDSCAGSGSRLRRSETAVAFVAMRSIIVAHAWKGVSLTSPIFNHKEASLYISNLFFLPSRHFLRHYDTSVRFATARTTTASSSCVGEQLQSRCGCVLTHT